MKHFIRRNLILGRRDGDRILQEKQLTSRYHSGFGTKAVGYRSLSRTRPAPQPNTVWYGIMFLSVIGLVYFSGS